MVISEIYKKYKIPPNLQLHQLRVAAVASLICHGFIEELNTKAIITACLLHDMGNILKFDFNAFPEFTKPEGVEYWESVKKEFKSKYGEDEHVATVEIIKEIGAGNDIVALVGSMGFASAQGNYSVDDYTRKICAYCDMRVAPNSVATLDSRLSEAKNRYVYQRKRWTETEFEFNSGFWHQIEGQIFEKCNISPEEINDESANPLTEVLKSFEI